MDRIGTQFLIHVMPPSRHTLSRLLTGPNTTDDTITLILCTILGYSLNDDDRSMIQFHVGKTLVCAVR